MSDFYEIDFLEVESKQSGDAITLRYSKNGTTRIHVIDGGFQETGDKIVDHINNYYDNPQYLNSVVLTHGDNDHAGGLRTILEEFTVAELWMLRPWQYSDELISRFSRFTSVENLKRRLKEIYPNIAALEDIALEKGIAIYEPFQGARIGEFSVLAPSKLRYLDLIVESEKTPEAKVEEQSGNYFDATIGQYVRKAVEFIKLSWGIESFPEEGTSAENETSIIQYANLCADKILLTGDAGRSALYEAAMYWPEVGLDLPGVSVFQAPHHGSRRNISTSILDLWLGKRLPPRQSENRELFTAVISSTHQDEGHPRKSVIRALIHRGAKVVTPEKTGLLIYQNSPIRPGWSSAIPLEYPEDQEG